MVEGQGSHRVGYQRSLGKTLDSRRKSREGSDPGRDGAAVVLRELRVPISAAAGVVRASARAAKRAAAKLGDANRAIYRRR